MKHVKIYLISGAALGALLLAPALGASALVAQTVDFPSQIEAGSEFQRTVVTTSKAETSRGSATEDSRKTVRFRVTELRDDGSGVLDVVIESARFRTQSLDGTVVTWDSEAAELPTDPALRVQAGMVGRTFEVPFLPGGAVDMAYFMEEPETDEAILERWTLALLVSPDDRADGLPATFPGALTVSEPLVVPTPFEGDATTWTYTLDGVTEQDGRSVARVEYSASTRDQGELSGHLLLDVETGRLLESVRIHERTLSAQDGVQTWRLEGRTGPAN